MIAANETLNRNTIFDKLELALEAKHIQRVMFDANDSQQINKEISEMSERIICSNIVSTA